MFELETINATLHTGGLAGLFVFTLISASLIPFGLPEAAVISLWALGFEPISVAIVASIGDVLGAIINYYIGRASNVYILRKFIKEAKLKKAEHLFNKYGPPILLLSWVPFIGDPLTAAAGLFKYQTKLFILYTTLGKTLRFILLYIIFISL